MQTQHEISIMVWNLQQPYALKPKGPTNGITILKTQNWIISLLEHITYSFMCLVDTQQISKDIQPSKINGWFGWYWFESQQEKSTNFTTHNS